MQEFKITEILEATGGRLISGDINGLITNISTDSRHIKDGDLFIPLVGKNFDGHDYIEECFNKGAKGCLTQRDCSIKTNKNIIKVEDTSRALLNIAEAYRKKFKITIVGVTGSVGKTSTKDMIAEVLGMKYNVLKNKGNLNNEIGVPLTLFNIDCFHEIGVIEMGMNNMGEISRISQAARPDIAVITNIGLSHIGNLGSKQNILKAKMEILDGLNEKGTVILNADDKLLVGARNFIKSKTIFFGTEEFANYQAYNVKSAGEHGTYFEITVKGRDYKVHIPAPGVHHVYSTLASIAVGIELGVEMNDIIEGIKNFNTGDMRLNIITHKTIKIINDSYNASPTSMEAAIDVLKELGSGKRKIAILGDMLELGDYSDSAHKEVGNYLTNSQINYIITVGTHAKHIAKGALESGFDNKNIFIFESNQEVKEFLDNFILDNDVILLKGSRGMRLEALVDKIKEFK